MPEKNIGSLEPRKVTGTKDIKKCDVCNDMTGTNIQVSPNLSKVYAASVAGCPYCNFCMYIWMSDINRDWATHYNKINGSVRLGMRWNKDRPGPVEVEFFYPFTNFAPPAMGKTRTYAVFNPTGVNIPLPFCTISWQLLFQTDRPILGWDQLGYVDTVADASPSDAPWLEFARHAIDVRVGHENPNVQHVNEVSTKIGHYPINRPIESIVTKVPEHTDCSTSNSNHERIVLPTRLIEIKPGDNDVILIETSKSSQICQYATLSHSWGSP